MFFHFLLARVLKYLFFFKPSRVANLIQPINLNNLTHFLDNVAL